MILNKKQVLDIMSETRTLGLSGKVSIDPSTLMDLGETIEALEKAAKAYQDLATCYRIGRRPTEKLFSRLGEARAALEGREKGE